MGYDQHWNFGIQQQIAETSSLTSNTSATKARTSRARTRSTSRNPDLVRFRPGGRFRVSVLQLHLQRRIHHLSRAAGEAGAAAVGRTLVPRFLHFLQEPLEIEYAAAGGRYRFERGPSEFHVPHTFAFSYGYELPFGTRQAIARGR